MEEIEVKFLNINPVEIENKLKKLGADRQFERLYRRRVFDYPDLRLDKQGAWLRLRDEGDSIKLAFKQRIGMSNFDGKLNDIGMEEIEIEVSDFDKTADILLKSGLKEKFYQENKRIRYVFDNIEFDIDFWPKLDPYLEIEATSWDDIDRGIKLLGLNPDDKKIFSTNRIYKLKGIEILDYKITTFERMVKGDNKMF
ncbi:class IV adenylate cyclase [Patescibacteria group bacterium]